MHTQSVRGLEGLWLYTLSCDEQESAYLPDDALPDDWNRKPIPPDWHEAPLKATQRIGNNWVSRQTSLILKVPSAVIPGDYNYLLNPAHPAFNTSQLAPAQRFTFDTRLSSLIQASNQ